MNFGWQPNASARRLFQRSNADLNRFIRAYAEQRMFRDAATLRLCRADNTEVNTRTASSLPTSEGHSNRSTSYIVYWQRSKGRPQQS